MTCIFFEKKNINKNTQSILYTFQSDSYHKYATAKSIQRDLAIANLSNLVNERKSENLK